MHFLVISLKGAYPGHFPFWKWRITVRNIEKPLPSAYLLLLFPSPLKNQAHCLWPLLSHKKLPLPSGVITSSEITTLQSSCCPAGLISRGLRCLIFDLSLNVSDVSILSVYQLSTFIMRVNVRKKGFGDGGNGIERSFLFPFPFSIFRPSAHTECIFVLSLFVSRRNPANKLISVVGRGGAATPTSPLYTFHSSFQKYPPPLPLPLAVRLLSVVCVQYCCFGA